MTTSKLDPRTWDRSILDRLASSANCGPKQLARGKRHGVSAQHPLSAYSGLQALRAGGSAADALVAMAGADTVLVPGTSSLGGSMSAVYYDASTATTCALNAGLNSVREDSEPYDHMRDRETGRAVLVPGVAAGLEATWRRFGRLPWRDLWLPAIWFAEEGFPIYDLYYANMQRRRDVLVRHECGRAIFARDGDLPQRGSHFRQPDLAHTLDLLANQGAAHFYQGDWAEELVRVVQRIGGLMTSADLAQHDVRWDEPTLGSYLDFEVLTCAAPHYGGPALLLALNLAEALDLHVRPSRSTCAPSLYDEVQAGKCAMNATALLIDPHTASPQSRSEFVRVLSKEWARDKAREIRTAFRSGPQGPLVCGSHHVAALDSDGNMVTATHTIESDSWGDTGLFVGGVSLNSSAFQLMEARPVPGNRVTEPLSTYVVLKDGRPVLAAGGIGSGLLAANLQNTVNVLGHGLDLGESIASPRWGYFGFDIATWTLGAAIQIEDLPSAILDQVEALGQPLERAGPGSAAPDTGFWTAVGYDKDGSILAVTDPRLMGLALAE